MILVIPAISDEYVKVKVSAKESGAWVDPTGDDVEFAFVTVGAEPEAADWEAGDWETDTTTTPDTYLARFEVSGYSAGDERDVWVRVTDNPEIPVRNVGTVSFV